jgi:hypothetical protein
VYDHHQKITSYNAVKKNDIICHSRPLILQADCLVQKVRVIYRVSVLKTAGFLVGKKPESAKLRWRSGGEADYTETKFAHH